MENRKIRVWEAPGGGAGATYIRCAGRFLDPETRPLAALLKVRFVQGASAAGVRLRSQRFAPLYIWVIFR